MALQRQPININFAQGLDQKTDPKQIAIGKFFALNNSVRTKGGLFAKRNGFGTLPGTLANNATVLTVFSDNLVAIGNTLAAYSQGTATWINKGTFQPVSFSTKAVVRSALNQIQCDSVVAANGAACTVYSESNNGTVTYSYVIQDSTTRQNITAPTAIPVTSGTVTGSPRVFLLGSNFVIVFTNVVSAASNLQYVTVSSTNPTIVGTNTDITAAYDASTTLSWDCAVAANNLYIAYNTSAGGQQVAITYLSQGLVLAAAQPFIGSIATIMSVCADLTTPSAPIIYASFWDSGSSTGYSVAVDQNLNQLMTATQWLATGTVLNVASAAQNGVVTIIYENSHNYSYDSGVPSHFLSINTITLPNTVTTGVLGAPSVLLRSVGLASKAFIYGGRVYVLSEYSSAFQPTYFLIDSSGRAIAKFAYQNGGGYLALGLPQAQVSGTTIYIAYLFKDLVTSVNKTQGIANAAGIYTQTGVNLGSISFSATALSSKEIGNSLNLSGGFLYEYDGNTLNEQNFHLFPDNVEATWSASGGSIAAQPDGATNTNAYFAQVIYQWTDAQGNVFNSAPSIPIAITTTGTGSSGSITYQGPMARITYKTNIKIIIYRWSVAQPSYYQVTSLTAPLLNSTTSDSWTFTDTLADASILGNGLIYTTGGVIENTGTSACNSLTLFDTRLWVILAENPNLLGYSKQVSDGTTVEMSDLSTLYIAPNVGTTLATGPMKCIFPMDDKLIIFKSQTLFYINGTGPDITGVNSQYSQPIFIPGTVGSVNPASIVLIPEGLLFQTDKGIWLLDRNLKTSYRGAAVENSNGATVTSAVAVPGTTQVRFTLNNGTAVMFDYYYDQWGTFLNVNAVSSTIYNGLHTYVTPQGLIAQETPGLYLDNGNPVLLSFTTGWINPAGIRGFLRLYEIFLVGEYISPHRLAVSIGYDYEIGTNQTIIINPINFAGLYGDDPLYGDSLTYGVYGGVTNVEDWRLFPQRQKCKAFQLTFTELSDPSKGLPAGAGFTLSGLDLVVGLKKGWAPTPAATSAG